MRRGFFYGRKFNDLEDLNHQALEWCNEEANTRVHGTTGEIPWERLQEEQGHLKPLPEVVAMPFVIEQRHATRTGLISVEGNQYSVPSRWARRTVRFRRYEKHLELLDGQEVIDIIQLEYGRGKRIIRDDHYPAHQRQRKTPSHPLQAGFEALAPEARAYLEGLTRSRVGKLRDQMQKIVALGEVYPRPALSRAMQRALAYGAFGYRSLKRILERQEAAPESLPDTPGVGARPLPTDLDVQVEKRDLTYYQVVGGAR